MNQHTATAVHSSVRDVILVLGMHRSGTSAVTGMLSKLGAALPEDLMPAAEANARGHFESNVLCRLHEELLEAAGSRWSDWRRFDPSWRESLAGLAFRARAREQFLAEFRDEPLVVLKDPRICRFVPFWLDVIGDLAGRPHAVIPIRSPMEVARSLRHRDGSSISRGLLTWLRHVLDAEADTRGIGRSLILWRDVLTDWKTVVGKISRDLDLAWPRPSDSSADEIAEFLSMELVHQRIDDTALWPHPDIHEWTRAAYRALLALAETPASTYPTAQLEHIRRMFDQACGLFDREFVDFEADIERTQTRIGLLQAKIDRFTAQLEGPATVFNLDVDLSRLIGEPPAEEPNAVLFDRDFADLPADIERGQARVLPPQAELEPFIPRIVEQSTGLNLEVDLSRLIDDPPDLAGAPRETAKPTRSVIEIELSDSDAQLETFRKQLAEARGQVDLLRAELSVAHQRLDRIVGSTAWQMTAPLRNGAALLPPAARFWLRRVIKAAYWAATPWKMPARARFLRER